MQKRTTIFRASAMLGAVSAVVVGATFALPPVSATLTNSSLTAATAGLEVDGPDAGVGFGVTDTGFTFTNLFPGSASWSEAQEFNLRNSGSTDLKIAVHKANEGGSMDQSKVHLRFTNVTTTETTTYTLDELATAKNLPGVSVAGQLDADDPETSPADESETNNFTVEVKLDEGASSSITGLDLVFTGTPQEEVPVVPAP